MTTQDTCEIRHAVPGDLEIIVDFNTALAHESEGLTLDPHVVRKGVSAALEDPARAIYFLASRNGRIVGQTMLTVEWSDWRNGFFWWIQSVYVDKSARRTGVFKALYDHVRTTAEERPDVCGLRLYVHHDNTNAIATYRGLGWESTDYLLCEVCW